MKRFLSISIGLLVAVKALGGSGNTNVTILLESVSTIGPHTNVWFLCNVSIENRSATPLTVTNLFVLQPGLALRITDLDGKELKRTYAVPLHLWTWTFAPGTQK